MIWNDFHFHSQTLGIETAAYVLLPEHKAIVSRRYEPIPTLYLLHGLSDDYTAWMRNTRIEQYARQHYVAVVMPAVNRSFYTDMAHGAKYWTFVSEELPSLMEAYFPLSKTREGRFAAGLSMGGYGAMKLGLLKPDRYAAIAALSAPLMMQEAFSYPGQDESWIKELVAIYGDEKSLRSGDGNLMRLAEMLDPKNAPHMYAACGTADFLFEANEVFMTAYRKKFDILYTTQPDAAHTWDFWDAQIREVIGWLPLTKLEGIW